MRSLYGQERLFISQQSTDRQEFFNRVQSWLTSFRCFGFFLLSFLSLLGFFLPEEDSTSCSGRWGELIVRANHGLL